MQNNKVSGARSPSAVRALACALAMLALAPALGACVPVAAGIGVVAVAAGNSEKGLGTSVNDGIINGKIHDLFVQNNISLFGSVDVTVNDGSVILTGKVKTPEHKVQATRIAWEVKGVHEVINELVVTDKSSLASIARDTSIGSRLRLRLISDERISSLNFSIDVVNGTIYLMGVAATEAEMRAAIAHARAVPKAKEVVNYVRIADDRRR